MRFYALFACGKPHFHTSWYKISYDTRANKRFLVKCDYITRLWLVLQTHTRQKTFHRTCIVMYYFLDPLGRNLPLKKNVTIRSHIWTISGYLVHNTRRTGKSTRGDPFRSRTHRTRSQTVQKYKIEGKGRSYKRSMGLFGRYRTISTRSTKKENPFIS